MRNKLGIVFMAAGVLCIIASAALLLYNKTEDRNAGNDSDKILQEMREYETASKAETSEEDTNETGILIDGNMYIGILSIPALNLELPVMEEWSYEGLRIAPCRYSGSVLTNNLVIAGHNYESHFGRIKNLNYGDMILFTDTNGYKTAYQVEAIETLDPTAVPDMTQSAYELTLFTCTYDGSHRTALRCSRIKTD